MIQIAVHYKRLLAASLFIVFTLLVLSGLALAEEPLLQEEPQYLTINGRISNVTIQPALHAGEWLVSLRELAQELGLTIGWLEESKTVRVKANDLIAYLQVGSEIALVNAEEKYLSQPLQIFQGRLMVPLSFIAGTFDYQLEPGAQSVGLRTPIESLNGVTFGMQEGRPVVNIKTSGLPRFESYLLSEPARIVIDLFDTNIDIGGDLSGYTELPEDSGIKGIRWHQFNASTARVVIDLKESVGFEVLPSGDGVSVALYKRVERLSFQRIFGKAQLEVAGTGKLDYSISYLHNPERVVIDLQKATLATAAQQTDISDELINKIRVSQFLPHVVRIVLELKYPIGCIATPTDDPNALLFELVKKVTGVEVGVDKGKQSLLITGGGLSNYAVEYFPDMAEILVDIPSAILSTNQPRLSFAKGPVSDVKLLQVAPTAVQVQIGLRGYLGHEVIKEAQGLKVLINNSPLAGRRVVIDPGHGGSDPGAIGVTGLHEKDVVLDIGLRLQELLVSEGAEVIMVRDNDCYIPLMERAQAANATKADVFVSIHVNSSVNPEASGTETYYYYADPEGQELAALVQREMLDKLGLNNRAPRPNQDFVVLRETKVPAILSEVAFISNRQEEALLKKPEFRGKAADSIYRGLMAYFGGPSWQYQDLISTESCDSGEIAPAQPELEETPEEGFSWETVEVAPQKPGEGIVDKVQVIEIH